MHCRAEVEASETCTYTYVRIYVCINIYRRTKKDCTVSVLMLLLANLTGRDPCQEKSCMRGSGVC